MAGDWAGLLNHSSYHLPLLGSGHRAWDAWHAGKPWNAAGHAGLFGVEAFGLRGVGKLQGAGRVRGTVLKRGGAKGARLKTEQGRVGEKGRVKEAKQREGVAKKVQLVEVAKSTATSLQEIKISSEGIQNIEKHLATMDFDQANQVMIRRLRDITSGTIKPTNVDLNFYAHELREMELMKQGMKYPEAHARALKEYGIEYKKGYQSKLYTQEAYDAGEAWYKNEAGFKNSDLL